MIQKEKNMDDLNKSIFSDMYKILNNRDFITESNLIYHYTSLDVLRNILKSRCFHLSHCSFMNDYTEFEYGITAFQDKLKEYISEEDDQMAVDLLDNLKNIRNTSNICVGSFTSLKDSLSQWRSYTSNTTGIAIGIQVDQLDSYCNNNGLLFGRVVYSDDFNKLFERFIKSLMPTIEHVVANQSETTIRDFNIILFVHLIVITCFIKHLGYREESEIRIVTGTGNKKTQNKFHRGLYIPYCEIDFNGNLLDMIREVWIGPATNQELLNKSVKLMLQEYGIINTCSVNLSKIPYRLIGE